LKFTQKEVAKEILLAKSKFWVAAKFASCLWFSADGSAIPPSLFTLVAGLSSQHWKFLFRFLFQRNL